MMTSVATPSTTPATVKPIAAFRLERHEPPLEQRLLEHLLAPEPVADERDPEQRVADTDDLVADRAAGSRELRDELADPEADGERGEGAPPPREVGALAREPRPSRRVDDVLVPLALHSASLTGFTRASHSASRALCAFLSPLTATAASLDDDNGKTERSGQMDTMEGTEGTKEQGRKGRRRLLLIPRRSQLARSLTAGVITGFGVTGSSGPASTTASPAAAVSATSIAKTTSSLDAATIYKQDSPGVVDIRVTEAAGQGSVSPFSPGGSQQATAEGTGYVYDKSGHIITADHVVSGASKITVRFKDGSTATATLVGTDPSTDTAVIKVSVAASKLTPLTLANSSTVEPGEGVVAIGSPFGYTESITAGIVSAVDRTIEAPNGYSISNTIQTDAPINHGNSGGPLIDGSGKVIGTNVQIAVDDQSSSSVNAGVGFAVPSNTVKTSWTR